MIKKKKTNNLFVGINGQHVGVLERRGGTHAFIYDDGWLFSEYAHPISLSMPLAKKRHTGDLVRFYFDNLLPDDIEIRKLIVDRIGAYSTDTMDLLSEIGRDCVGSLSLTSEPVDGMEKLKLELMSLADIEEHLENTVRRKTLGMDDDNVFRISLAGAQEKTALTLHEGRWHRPIGSTPTTHIFKLPINDLENGLKLAHSVDNEWFCLRFMRHLGFNVAHADIHTFGVQKALVVERFDRQRGEDGLIYRLTQEDMCQALGRAGQSKYEAHGGPGAREISNLLRFSTDSENDMYQFFLAQYTFWLLMGIDGHAKNFSVYLDHTGHWLTPLYDVISAHPFKDQFRRKELKMAMKVTSKNNHYIWADIQMRHWASHAAKTFLDENLAMEYIAALNVDIEVALNKTFEDAPADFDQDTGNQIAEGVLSKLNK
jgi:serine/threonine-protein kinase HipA